MEVEKLVQWGKKETKPRAGLFILEKTGVRRETQRQRKRNSAELEKDNANHGTTVVQGSVSMRSPALDHHS